MAAEPISETLLLALFGGLFAVAMVLRFTRRAAWGRRLGIALLVAGLSLLALGVDVRPTGTSTGPLRRAILIDVSASTGTRLGERIPWDDVTGVEPEDVIVIAVGAEARIVFRGSARDIEPRDLFTAALLTPEFRARADFAAAFRLLNAALDGDDRVEVAIVSDGGFDLNRATLAATEELRRKTVGAGGFAFAQPPPDDLHVRFVADALHVAPGEERRVALEVFGLVSAPRRVDVVLDGGERGEAVLSPGLESVRLHLSTGRIAAGRDDVEAALIGHEQFDASRTFDRARLPIIPATGVRRVAVIGSQPRALDEFVSGLSQARPDWRIRARTGLGPDRILEDAIVLLDAPIPASLSAADLERLDRTVRSGAALVIGGAERAFGLGGQAETALDAMSPLTAEPPRRPLTAIVVLDRSGSMEQGERFRSAVRATAALHERLGERDRMKLIAFADTFEVRDIAPKSAGATRLEEIAKTARPRGGTRLVEALDAAFVATAGDDVESDAEPRRVVIVLSDARDPRILDGNHIDRWIDAAQADDVRVVFIWFDRDGAYAKALTRLTESTDGRLVDVDDFADLRRIFLEEGTRDLVALDVPLQNLVGAQIRLPRILRTGRSADAEVSVAAGEDLNVAAHRRLGAGRVTAMPIALDASNLEAVFGGRGFEGFADFLTGAMAPRRPELGLLGRRPSGRGEIVTLTVAEGVEANPAAIVVAEQRFELFRRGFATYVTDVVDIPEGASSGAVLDAADALLNRAVLPSPDLFDRASRPRPANVTELAAFLTSVAAGAPPIGAPIYFALLLLAALLVHVKR